jgi:hypothetical protein
MIRSRIILIWLLTTCFLVSSHAATQLRVTAQVNTQTVIYPGQTIAYSIVVAEGPSPESVDIGPISRYNPRQNGTERRNINGRRFSIVNFLITTPQPGLVRLPGLNVTVSGKTYKTNPVEFTVSKPGTTDKLDLAVDVSDSNCYLGQPVLLTVKAYVETGSDAREIQFDLPVFTGGQFILEDPVITDGNAEAYRLSTDLVVYVSQREVVRKRKRFTEVSFSKVLIPQEIGTIPLGTATLSAALAVGLKRSRDPFDMFGARKQYSRFMVSNEMAQLTVRPLPTQGQPRGFYGLVGQYTIEATATPTQVNVGDPITLTIRIGGNRFLKPVQWPKLSDIDELNQHFRIPTEKASPTVVDGYKQFVQTIRASSDKVTEIPALKLPYFDTDQGAYRIAQTDPIKLKVAPTKVLTSGDLGGNQVTPVNRKVEAIKKGLAANYEDLDALVDREFTLAQAITGPVNLAFWLLPLLGLVGTSVYKVTTFSTPERIVAKQKRLAAGQAYSQLRAALSLQGQPCSEALGFALKRYLGKRCHKTAASLTPLDCHELIISETTDIDLAQQYQVLLEMCEASHYSASRTEVDSKHVNQAIDLIRKLEKKISS